MSIRKRIIILRIMCIILVEIYITLCIILVVRILVEIIIVAECIVEIVIVVHKLVEILYDSCILYHVLDEIASIILALSLVEIHNQYLYKSRRDCVGSVTFRRSRDLTNCASYDTLAKLA
jgi:hypothetical protein